MKITPAIAIARKIAGYIPPREDKMCCKYCGAKRNTRKDFAPYYCVRHMFYVHSRGVCPKFDMTPYNPPPEPEPKKPQFVQEEMFK